MPTGVNWLLDWLSNKVVPTISDCQHNRLGVWAVADTMLPLLLYCSCWLCRSCLAVFLGWWTDSSQHWLADLHLLHCAIGPNLLQTMQCSADKMQNLLGMALEATFRFSLWYGALQCILNCLYQWALHTSPALHTAPGYRVKQTHL